jgi:hypothetical protein
VLHPPARLHENRWVVYEEYQQKAIRLLSRCLHELKVVRVTNYKSPMFKAWHDTTSSVLETFLGPHSPYTNRFRSTRFLSMTVEPFDGDFEFSDAVSTTDGMTFRSACDTTEASLKAAIRHVEDFGAYIEEEVKPVPLSTRKSGSGGVTQTFHGPVTIHAQAIATDSAIQKIGHMGDATGASLKEIANLLQRSEDLTQKQVKEGLAGIEALAVEVEKPEGQRNWKAVIDYGQKVLDIAGRATDLGIKLAPFTPAIIAHMENAGRFIK